MQSARTNGTLTLSSHIATVWQRITSLGTFLASLGFLSLAVLLNPHFSTKLFPLMGTTLILAVLLSIYSLWNLRVQYQGADSAFRNADREYFSIFQNALDGILILDDDGCCLDANPAATEILRCERDELVGNSISRFLAAQHAFNGTWRSLLRTSRPRGRECLITGDGTQRFVDFTAASNYLPGRHVLILCDATERANAEILLKASEERFQHMANNIQEIFWMMDAATQEVTYVNRAYAAITGYSVDSLCQNPSSYRELIQPEDRVRVLSRLHETATSGVFDEEFRFTRADGIVRWIWAKGFPVPSDGQTRWLVGTAQDITSRKQAEMKIIDQLDTVEAARAETEALRKSTLALSQNLAMDSVLDTLLQCISELVPFDRATVLFVEDGFELMVARETPRIVPKRIGLTFGASESTFLERVLFEKRATLVPDVAKEAEWRDAPPLDHVQSWLGIPLVAAGHVLGILSLGSNAPHILTAEHLRLAKSLAVPAAVAIQNARTHERAEIYAAELELRLHELREAQKALEHVEKRPLRSDKL
jgi:PAS domain S-box-containing protein